MASLAIIRKALRFMFTAEELKYLDSYPDADEEDALEPQPDLEKLARGAEGGRDCVAGDGNLKKMEMQDVEERRECV